MSQVIQLSERIDEARIKKNCLYRARREYGLTVLEAAEALGISAHIVEREERGEDCRFSDRSIKSKFEYFVASIAKGEGKNLIFHSFPLRVAREILGLEIEEMAAKYGCSKSHWKKLEANYRKLTADKLDQIEQDVRSCFLAVCNN